MKRYSKTSLMRAMQRIVLCGMMTGPVMLITQVVQAQDGFLHQYHIPASSLDQALSLFGAQSGIIFAFDPKQVQHLKSKGLEGRYAIDEGFTALLAPHGLHVKLTDKGYVLIAKNKPLVRDMGQLKQINVDGVTVNNQDHVQSLPVIRVTADQQPDQYLAKKISLGKTTQSLKETPQSVSVVTRQRLDDQNISSLEEAMKTVTGVTVQRFDSAGTYSNFAARGYGSDTYQIDGTSLLTDSNGSYFDLAIYDQIEVLRGPAGLFSGAGEPGVTFNMVRKKALATPSVETKVSIGSWNDYRTDLDVTGALNDDGNIRGRFVSVLRSYDTYMTAIDDNRKALAYGTLEFDTSEHSTVSVGATYQYIDTVLSRGLPTWVNGQLLDVPRSTTLVQDWNNQQLEATEAFAEFKQHFANDSDVKATVRFLDRKNRAQYSDPTVPDSTGNIYAFNASALKRQDQDLSTDLFYNQPFQLFGQQHNFLIGADYLKSKANTNYAADNPITNITMNIYHENSALIAQPDFIYGVDVSKTELETYGIYSQLRIKPLNMLTLIAGGRISWWDNTTYTYMSDGVAVNSTENYKQNAKFTPYASILLDINPHISVYSSYSQIFQPQNSYRYDANDPTGVGIQLDPRTGTQVELGLKSSWLDDQLNVSTAIFQIDDKNRSMIDPEHDLYSIASGRVRSRGFELEMLGKLTEHLNLSAGYAYNTNKYLEDSSNQGQIFSTFTPKHSVNFWTHYQMPDEVLSGLELGLGLRAVSKFYNQAGTLKIQSDGYHVVDGSVSYKLNPNIKLGFNVYNLLDESYWEKVSFTARQNFYGSPRQFMLTLTAKY